MGTGPAVQFRRLRERLGQSRCCSVGTWNCQKSMPLGRIRATLPIRAARVRNAGKRNSGHKRPGISF